MKFTLSIIIYQVFTFHTKLSGDILTCNSVKCSTGRLRRFSEIMVDRRHYKYISFEWSHSKVETIYFLVMTQQKSKQVNIITTKTTLLSDNSNEHKPIMMDVSPSLWFGIPSPFWEKMCHTISVYNEFITKQSSRSNSLFRFRNF